MIENGSGMTASIMTYGAVIKNLYVPGENGKADDVVLGAGYTGRIQKESLLQCGRYRTGSQPD